MIAILPLFASLGVFLALVLEKVYPHPFIVEELIKGGLVYVLLTSKDEHTNKGLNAILIGVMFGITESSLYGYMSILAQEPLLLLKRIVITVSLHTVTTITIFYFGKLHIKLTALGVISAILMHYVYNLVSSY